MSRWAVATMGRLSVDHIAAVEGLQGPVTIERRCADLPELIAVCRAGRADAALIIGETHQLTATVLGELRADGRHVVVVSHVAEERSRLQRLGVRTFPDEVSPTALAQALQGRDPADAQAPKAPTSMNHSAQQSPGGTGNPPGGAETDGMATGGLLARGSRSAESADPAQRNGAATPGSTVPAPEVIINKVRSAVIGRSPRDQLSQTWLRLGPTAQIQAFLPWDATGCDSSLLAGQVLAEAAPNSVLRRSIARLAGADLPARRRGPLRRGRR